MNSNWVQKNWLVVWTQFEVKTYFLNSLWVPTLVFWTHFELNTYCFEFNSSSQLIFLNSIRVQNFFLNSIRFPKLCVELDLIFPHAQNKRAKKNESNSPPLHASPESDIFIYIYVYYSLAVSISKSIFISISISVSISIV